MWTKGCKKGRKCELAITATAVKTISIEHGCVPPGANILVVRVSDQIATIQVPKYSQLSTLPFEQLAVQQVKVSLCSISIKPTTIIFKPKQSSITIKFGYYCSSYE